MSFIKDSVAVQNYLVAKKVGSGDTDARYDNTFHLVPPMAKVGRSGEHWKLQVRNEILKCNVCLCVFYFIYITHCENLISVP